MKQILIMKTANGYIAVPSEDESKNAVVCDVGRCQVFTTLKASASYMHDGIEDFLEEYFKAQETEVEP